ncbi:MAG: phage tail sheath subtilisin-like domain-containing protein, partial [Polyangiaceae bacterium]
VFRLELDPNLNGQEVLFPGTILTIVQGTSTITRIVESVFPEHLPTIAKPTYRVTLRRGSDVTFDLDPGGALASVVSEEFDVRVTMDGASTPLVFAGLGFDAAHPRFYQKVLNEAADVPITFEPIEPAALGILPGSLPADITVLVDGSGPQNGVLGEPETLVDLLPQDFIDALDTLEPIDDVNLVACPDDTSDTMQQAMIAHCELMADRFAILDSRVGAPPYGANSVELHRQSVVSPRGYAALYYPWLKVPPLGPGAPILVPPSGHVCGVIARSDAGRGVHKAPANEIFAGALGVERVLSDSDHGQLNLQGVNVTRVFGGVGRPTLFGARTTASDLNWLHVSTRRLFLYIEESLAEGIRWAIFEPNNLQLWKKLKRSISEFLVRVWRDGGLFGATREEAFYVRIDEDLNPFSEQALGRLHIEIGLRPTYPRSSSSSTSAFGRAAAKSSSDERGKS